MHADVHVGGQLTYWILQRLDPEARCCGAIGADSMPGLGEIPLEMAASWDFATRSAAAMMASSMVSMGSSAETTETIPASHA
jgi:hypothetical protein